MTEKRTSYVNTVNDRQAAELQHYLAERGWQFRAQLYARWKAVKDKTNVVVYNSGKLTVQGPGTEDFVLFVLEPEILKTSGFGYETAAVKEPFFPHGGVDESGKGDFFGPLVIAGVFVDERTAPVLREAGVRDSKTIRSSRQIKLIAAAVRQAVGGKFAVVPVGPAAYNRLYGNFGNLNRLLAWGHAKVIENLLEKAPECREVLADKFAAEHLIKNALQQKGRTIVLRQQTKAESDLAVAAASILARDVFLRAMEKLSREAGFELPRGAGPAAAPAGEKIVCTLGSAALVNFAKLHFKTSREIGDN
ncbi:MAG: ribonuclease HIII [Victivallales bacterium]|nr:ribonuclease HIII [Victivallales bacterium]